MDRARRISRGFPTHAGERLGIAGEKRLSSLFVRRGGTPIVLVAPPAAKFSTEVIRIEVLLLFRKAWRVVCTNQPSCHPRVLRGKREVSDTSVNVVPAKLAPSSFLQSCLCVAIELAEIVKCCRGNDCCKQVWRRARRVVEHRFSPLLRAIPYRLNMSRIRITALTF